jgi:hypothetical protein
MYSKRSHANPGLVEKAANLRSEIPGLYISKAYKAFITSSSNHRLPHYLQQVHAEGATVRGRSKPQHSTTNSLQLDADAITTAREL